MASRRINRRTLLKLGALGVPTAAAAGGGLGYLWATADTDTTGRIAFTNRLHIPPLALSRRDDTGREVPHHPAPPASTPRDRHAQHHDTAGRPHPSG